MNDGLPASLAEVLEVHGRTLQSRVHTGVPAKVVKYDPTTNTIDAEIVVRNAVWNRNGEREYEEFPHIPAVPVLWPRAGGMVVRLPLEPGDFVWLAFSEAALGEWRSTGQLSDPKDARRHSIGYPVAIPGAFPDTDPMSPADVVELAAGALIIGDDGGTAQIIIGGTIPGVRFGKLAVSPVALAVPLLAFVSASAAASTAGGASDAAVSAALTAIQAALAAIAAIPANAAAAAAVTSSGAAVSAASAATAAAATAATAAGAAATTAAGAVPSTLTKSV